MGNVDLKEFFERLLKNWLVIILCCIIGMSAAFIYSEFFATPMYSSSIKISITNTDWQQGSVSSSDISTTEKLVEGCIIVLKDDVMSEKVSGIVKEQSGINYSTKSVQRALSFSQVGESGFIEVRAKCDDPEMAALLCNAVSAEAPELIVSTFANVQVKTLGTGAKVNYNPVSPNTVKNVFFGFILSLLAVCGVIFLIVYFDNTVSSEDKLRERYDLSVLGVVPHVNEGHKVDAK